MKRIALSALTLAFALSFTSATDAATVIFKLYVGNFAQGPGTFKVTAQSSLGDNFGIASYGLQFVGNPNVGPGGSILTVNHSSLRAASVENGAMEEGPAGFTLLRSADDTNATVGSAVLNIAASQDTIVPTPHLIRGFGQTPGSLLSVQIFPSGTEGDPWGNAGTPVPGYAPPTPGEFEIARGTYVQVPNGGNPGIPRGIDFIGIPTAATFANVFRDASGIGTMAATVRFNSPEPSSLALAGLGALSGVAYRRRRA